MVHGSFAKKEAALREQLTAAEQQAAHWQAIQMIKPCDVCAFNTHNLSWQLLQVVLQH
jgi:hypothetical protein